MSFLFQIFLNFSEKDFFILISNEFFSDEAFSDDIFFILSLPPYFSNVDQSNAFENILLLRITKHINI
ncbi:hypothetical protein BpHYR1_023211 [Brachionus plicatilis]|uniref:Uncharacterized protein n=1 Tax=Brachionus plicatilis TaxID=10195 RepID=A0A3M7PU76_BRAPC|nr:hypothetical protein BpHYR1_023211 [Brachionus plicatilis]